MKIGQKDPVAHPYWSLNVPRQKAEDQNRSPSNLQMMFHMVLNYPVLGVCKSGIFSRETVDVRPRSHPNPLSFPSPAVDGAQPPHQASVAEPCPARSPPWPGRSWQGRTPGMEQETAGVSNPELEGFPGVARLGIVEISGQNARTCKRLQKHILLLAAASQRYAA